MLYRPEYKASHFGRVESHGTLNNLGFGLQHKASSDNLSSDHNDREEEKHKLLWNLMSEYLGHDVTFILNQVKHHIHFTLGATKENLQVWSLAVAASLKDRLIECFNDTQ